jgi:peptidoglycan-N-acetylmuramic acid deacetylase
MKKVGVVLIIVFIYLFGIFALGKSIEALNNNLYIDNTNHGWGVKKNSEHKQPEVPKDVKDTMEKYNCIYVGDKDKKYLYLTIDLGYESGNTSAILDVLNKNHVLATFFIVSSYLEKNKDIVDRIVKEGHSIQNHTTNYVKLNTLDDNSVRKEIMDLHNIVKERYGISMKYLRTPFEEWSERVLKIAMDEGYRTVFWSVACVDWVEDKDANYIYSSIMNNHHNGAVILVHSISKSSPNAIDMIVSDLIKKGYEFKLLDE